MEADTRVPVMLLSETRTGAIVTVKDEEGREYRGRVLAVEGEAALVRIFQELDFPSESPLPDDPAPGDSETRAHGDVM